MNDLNMLLSCFREKMPVIDATRQKNADGRRERRRGGTTTAEAFGSLPTLVWFPLVAVVVVVALLRSVARALARSVFGETCLSQYRVCVQNECCLFVIILTCLCL